MLVEIRRKLARKASSITTTSSNDSSGADKWKLAKKVTVYFRLVAILAIWLVLVAVGRNPTLVRKASSIVVAIGNGSGASWKKAENSKKS